MCNRLKILECCTEETKHHTGSNDLGIITVNFGYGAFWFFGKVICNMYYYYSISENESSS